MLVETSRFKIGLFSQRSADNVKFSVITFILQVREKKIEKWDYEILIKLLTRTNTPVISKSRKSSTSTHPDFNQSNFASWRLTNQIAVSCHGRAHPLAPINNKNGCRTLCTVLKAIFAYFLISKPWFGSRL